MAIFRTGPLASAVSGSVGGTTFTRTRGGATLRARTARTDRTHPAQQQPRTTLAIVAHLWGGDLTQAQRDGWATLADATLFRNRLGRLYNPTGYSLYVRHALVAIQLNLAPQAVAPPNAKIQIPAFIPAYMLGVGARISPPAGNPAFPVAAFYWQFSQPLPVSSTVFHGPWAGDDIDVHVFGPWTGLTLLPKLELEAGRRYFFRLRLYSAGGGTSSPILFTIDTPDPLV